MRDIDIEEQALCDIEDLTCESLVRLGVEHAARYYDELFRQFDLLAEFPSFAQPVSGSFPDALQFGFGSHIIIFSADSDRITIRRLFHGDMDLLRYL